ncbi:MAG: ATP-binding protein, partial [Ktedonobacteraceae bacterium]
MQSDPTFPEMAIISVTDITQQVQIRRQLEGVQKEQTRLMNELGSANTRLSDMNKELMDSNEELQVANEELILTHEELQASIEEFETTNEELQATNEELETNNEELQATNEEFETTNDELRARTNELQELSTMLENERRRLAEIIELAPFYIMMLRGPSLIVEAYNPRYARQIEQKEVQGHPLDEAIDLFWENGLEIVHLARDAYRLNAMQKTRRVLTHLYHPQDQPDGPENSYFSYTAVPSCDSQGKVDGVLLYALDETVEHFREVEEERERLKLIFNNVSLAALALFDAQTGKLLMGSTPYLASISRMTHRVPEDLIGHAWSELAPDKQAAQTWEAVVQKHTIIHIPELVTTMLSENRQEQIWNYTVAPLMDNREQGTGRYVLVSLFDITEQVQARRELEQIDSLKDDFLSLAAHELRTPLTTIQGNAQMLHRILRKAKEQPSTETELAQTREREMRTLDTIAHQVTRMNRLIAEMLDVTRIRGNVLVLNKVEKVQIVPLVQRVIEPYKGQGREIILHANDGNLTGTYDPDRLEQVLTNLMSNAIKYSPANKPIVVTITPKDAEVIISIRDEGIGISAEDQAHLFERFYRTEKARSDGVEGLGLGLYIAHEIIIQQGGRMWCESKKGQGSTFYFSLPLQ